MNLATVVAARNSNIVTAADSLTQLSMHILVTNDDGPESPFVLALVKAAALIGSVTVVLPHSERSWTAKAMTRNAELRLTSFKFEGERFDRVTSFTLEGTPADCVNAGFYHLCPKRPDLVLSGVNVGENTGVAYVASSGTIGACIEANIAGVPSIAFSQQLSEDAFASWSSRDDLTSTSSELVQTANQLERMTPQILEKLSPIYSQKNPLSAHKIPVWSVNIPWHLSPDWRIVPCSLDRARYGSCFQRNGEVFRHVGAPAILNRDEGADVSVLADGCVSLTLINLWSIGQEVVSLPYI